MKMTKRVAAILIAVMMLLTTMPLYAAAETEISEIAITNADITPVVGDAVSKHTAYTIPSDAHYTESDYYWRCETTAHTMGNSEVFEAGKEYALLFKFKPDEGYKFAGTVTITINGSSEPVDIDFCGPSTGGYIVWTKPVEAVESKTITEITITNADITPVAGDSTSDHLAYTLPENCHYTVSGHNWFDDDAHSEFYDTFVEGTRYSLNWEIIVDEGYEFDSNATITINGSTTALDTDNTNLYSDGCDLWTLPTVATKDSNTITEIAITGVETTPEVGESAVNHLAYTLPENCHYFVTEHYWYDEDSGSIFNDAFVEGDEYSLYWKIVADSGYTFDENVTITINGSTAAVDTDNTGVYGTDCDIWSMPTVATQESNTITEIAITGADITPVAGDAQEDHLDYDLLLGCRYSVDDHLWLIAETGSSFTGPFVEGNEYCVGWILKADSGYVFDENATVTINGSTDNVFTLHTEIDGEDNTLFYVWATPAVAGDGSGGVSPLSIEVEISGAPYGGDSVYDLSVTQSNNVPESNLYACYWDVYTSDDPEAPLSEWEYAYGNKVFETGANYMVLYRYYLNSTAYNAETVLDTATLKIDGEAPDCVEASNEDGATMVAIGKVYKNIAGLPEMPYNLVVGNTVVTEKNAADILGDGTAAYDAATNTLTLTDCNLTKGFEWHTLAKGYAGIFAYGDLNLCVKGTNTVSTNAEGMTFIDAIHVNGRFTLCGDGSLTVTAGESYGSSALFVGGNIDVFAEGDYTFESGNLGICTYSGTVKLYPNKMGATVTVKGGNKSMIAGSLDYYDFEITSGGETLSSADTDKTELVFTAAENSDYGLFVGGVEVTESNKADILGNGTASFDPTTKTLTLTNANITAWSTDGEDDAIFSKKPLNVVLVGDNTIDMTGAGTAGNAWGAFVNTWWNLTVTGDGNLTLKTDAIADSFIQNGLYAYYDVTVDMGGKLTISFGDGNVADSEAYAVFASDGAITYSAAETAITIGDVCEAKAFFAYTDAVIRNGGSFTISVGKTEYTNIIEVYENLLLTNTGTMTFTSDEVVGYNYGLYSGEDMTVQNSGTLTVNVGGCTGAEAYARAVFCDGNLVIESSKELTLTTGDVPNGASRVVDQDQSASGITFDCSGTVNLTAGDGRDYSSVMDSDGYLVIGGDAKYTFIAGDTSGGYGEGCYASDTFTVKDKADVTVKVGNANSSIYGIESEDIIIKDNATVSIEVGEATDSDGWSIGIDGWDSVTISTAGDVTVTAGKAGQRSAAILSEKVTVSGSGSLTATADEAGEDSYAIRLYDDTEDEHFIRISGTAKDGKITLTGKTAAVNFVPEYDDKAYEAKGDKENPGEMADVAAADMTSCKQVVLTALENVKPIGGDVMYGDANGDGAVNMKDVLALRKQLAGMPVTIVDANADVNGDGSVNMKDVLQLRKFLAGIISELKPAS